MPSSIWPEQMMHAARRALGVARLRLAATEPPANFEEIFPLLQGRQDRRAER
jgi:hypothetical protein